MITFNNVSLPTGIEVRSITRSVLPELSRQTIKIFGRAGTYGLAKEVGERVFTVEFILNEATEALLLAQVRTLARFLYSEEPVKFIIDTEPDYYYMAMVDGTTDLEQLIDEVGVVQIQFYCSQPYAIKTATEQSYTVSAPANNNITNNGDVPSSPRFELTFLQPSTYIEFLNNTTKKSFRMGSVVRLGEQNPFADKTNIITNHFETTDLSDVTILANGTQFNPSLASDGTVTATMLAKTKTIAGTSQKAYGLDSTDSWGANAGWHGAGIEKELASNYEDFSVEIDVQMQKNNSLQTSKMEVYLFGTDGSEILKLNFNDGGLGMVNPQLWCRFNTPTPYAVGAGNIIGFTGTNASAMIQKYRPSKHFFNVDGIIKLRIAKRLNNWRIWIAKIDPSDTGFGKVLVQDLFEINDPLQLLNQSNLKKVRMTMGVYGTTATSGMYFHKLIVNQENASLYDPETNIKYCFYAGDILTVDMLTAKVYVNGIEDYQFIDPSSDFWKLAKGVNDVAIFVPSSSVDNTKGKVWLNERYL